VTKKVIRIPNLKEQAKRYMSSLDPVPRKGQKLNINLQVRFVGGQLVVEEDIQLVDRGSVHEEMLGGDLAPSDWQTIWALPELSREQRRAEVTNQVVYAWLKRHAKSPTADIAVDRMVQGAFNGWCRSKDLPYRISHSLQYRVRSSFMARVGKLF
jgi:hypothetical protein